MQYGSTTVNWARTKDFTEAFAKITQSLALVAGGVWAYFKFVKGRTFQDRLTPTVSGKFVSIDGSVFLIVRTLLENVGLSRIVLDRQLSSLVVFEYVPSEAEEILNVQSKWLTVLEVFGDKDKYIEPKEIVERQTLIALPKFRTLGISSNLRFSQILGMRGEQPLLSKALLSKIMNSG